ncbi:MAG: c-type cytochrome [Saprospiraceae bacterium]|nr:c-type cytochrome [Saprospiraceae bacterium]
MSKPILLLVCIWLSGAFVSPVGSPYALKYPTKWPKPTYDFSKNPTTVEGVALGRKLFYDPILSRDSSISCSHCHLSYTAFAHVDHALSHGIADRVGKRNAPAMMNLAWSRHFMWDGAVNHLDVQALAPITHPAEMDDQIGNVVKKLQATPHYPALFEAAFGDRKITGEKVLKSIAQFELTLISAGSKYDRVQAGVDSFTAQEKNGYRLFQLHCNQCHTEPLFTNGAFENNGLPIDTALNDKGRSVISQDAADDFKFKVPTLRNIEFSYPYMHDGRFKKLKEVLRHYTEGVQVSPTLSGSLRNKITLNDREKVDLTAFLLTLTDKEFLFNPAFSFPKE